MWNQNDLWPNIHKNWLDIQQEHTCNSKAHFCVCNSYCISCYSQNCRHNGHMPICSSLLPPQPGISAWSRHNLFTRVTPLGGFLLEVVDMHWHLVNNIESVSLRASFCDSSRQSARHQNVIAQCTDSSRHPLIPWAAMFIYTSVVTTKCNQRLPVGNTHEGKGSNKDSCNPLAHTGGCRLSDGNKLVMHMDIAVFSKTIKLAVGVKK